MTSGYMPVLKSVVENENYAAWLEKANGFEQLVATCVKTGIEGRDDYFVSPAFKGSSVAREQVGNLLIKCLTSKSDAEVDEAFEEAISECEYHN